MIPKVYCYKQRIMYNRINDLPLYNLKDSKTLEPLSHRQNVNDAEVWSPIPGYERTHYVSSHGRVFRVTPFKQYRKKTDNPFKKRRSTHFLKQYKTPKGYSIVHLDGHTKTVHSLVLEAFVGPKPEGYWARHHDNNKNNNRLDNLSWDTPRTNIHDKIKFGTICRGEKFWSAKLKETDIPDMVRMREAGESYQSIADRYGVNYATAWRALNGQSWKHVERPQ